MNHHTTLRTTRSSVALLAAAAFTLARPSAAYFGAPVVPLAQAQAGSRQITIERATELALREVPGGRVESVERDSWRGRPVYEVELVDADGWEVEVVIEADNGQVLDKRTND